MKQQSRYYLQQMGIPLWQCRKPELYPHLASEAKKVDLPKSCKILVVSNENLHAHSHFIAQVLRTLQLELNQCHIVTDVELLNYYQEPEWLWFLGCPQSHLTTNKQLTSPKFDQLLHSAKAKKQLWQQIVRLLN